MISDLWAPLEVPRKRRRGGWRQQLAEHEPDLPSVPSAKSQLATGHLLKWADGLCSATTLQAHMDDALKDGFSHPMIHRLGHIGPRASPQNCQKGLMQLLQNCGVVDLVSTVENVGGAAPVATHIVLPSTYIKLLHSRYKKRSIWNMNRSIPRRDVPSRSLPYREAGEGDRASVSVGYWIPNGDEFKGQGARS